MWDGRRSGHSSRQDVGVALKVADTCDAPGGVTCYPISGDRIDITADMDDITADATEFCTTDPPDDVLTVSGDRTDLTGDRTDYTADATFELV